MQNFAPATNSTCYEVIYVYIPEILVEYLNFSSILKMSQKF